MEKDAFTSISEFDSYTTTRHLKMMKVSLPFLPIADKGMLYVYIKFSELVHTISLFRKPQTFFPCPTEKQWNKDYQMLFSALSVLGNDEETRMFSQLSSIFNAFTMYESYAPLFKMMMELGGDGMFGGINPEGDLFGGMDVGADGFPDGMDVEKIMSMAQIIKQFTTGVNKDSEETSIQVVDAEESSPAFSEINPSMLEAMLSPEQLELFKRFKDNI